VNWAVAWHLLGGDDAGVFQGGDGLTFRARWLESIYQHCHFIPRHWSRHSSANNHLLGEATGLFVAAVTWPMWSASAGWARQAQAELEREGLAQTFADGVNKEQATWYHHAVADMMLIAGLFARANGRDFGKEYWGRLEAMLEFIASVMDVGGSVPLVGDADAGVLVRFVPGDSCVFRSLLATGAVLFANESLRVKAGVFDAKSRWLLGDAAAVVFSRPATAEDPVLPVRRAFPQGGYFILGQDFETPREVRIVADAGPLGYLAIAAHGHADALAFTLSVAGKPILTDPGTFSYSAMPWRRYFRSTAAHNTVVVEGRDQSEYGGSFLWLAHANAAVDAFYPSGDEQILTAHHDGYRRLADPVRHRRTWRYAPATAVLGVTDELICEGRHSVAVYWHFAPECVVVVEEGRVIALREGVRVTLTGPGGLRPSVVIGQTQPPLGWFSRGVDTKVPATTAVFAGEIQGTTCLTTELAIERRP
jgi:hypothetical protein